MAERVRISLLEAMTDADLARELRAFADGLVGQPLEKALKDPLPRSDREAARRAFVALQVEFAADVKDIYASVDDACRLRDLLDPGLQFRGEAAEVMKRVHSRAIGQLNRRFARDYRRAFELGLLAGGRRPDVSNPVNPIVKPNEEAVLKRLRLNENRYAGQFLTDIETREGTMPYGERAKLYGNALEETYWQGFLYADLSADRYLQWRMSGVGSNCPDCGFISGNLAAVETRGIPKAVAKQMGAGGRWGNGVYSARELAAMEILPQSARLACTTHCHCTLTPVDRPGKKPQGKEIATRFESLAPKHFTGTTKDAKGRIVVTRQHEKPRRLRYAKGAAKTEHRHIKRGETPSR